MSRYCDENRRDSTIRRDERVHDIYDRIMAELGEVSKAVSRSYIYGRIKSETGLCERTVAFILNHTEPK